VVEVVVVEVVDVESAGAPVVVVDVVDAVGATVVVELPSPSPPQEAAASARTISQINRRIRH
jgi:hypothetical protein